MEFLYSSVKCPSASFHRSTVFHSSEHVHSMSWTEINFEHRSGRSLLLPGHDRRPAVVIDDDVRLRLSGSLFRLFVDVHRVQPLFDALPSLTVFILVGVVVVLVAVVVGDFLGLGQVAPGKFPQLLDDFRFRLGQADRKKVDNHGTDFIDGSVFNDLEYGNNSVGCG